jgi:hypothetical protein
MSRAAILRLEPPTTTADPAILACELDVLGRWYGDTAEDLDGAYGGFAEQTIFIAVRDDSDRVIGFIRILRPGTHRLKTITDIGRQPWAIDPVASVAAAGIDLARCWDIATLGVRPEYGSRGSAAATALYFGLLTALRLNGAEWAVAIIDQRVRKLASLAGYTLLTLPGTAPAFYMGSPACAPVYVHVPSMLDRQQREQPLAYQRITLGAGLEGVSVPPEDTFRLPAHRGSGPDRTVHRQQDQPDLALS